MKQSRNVAGEHEPVPNESVVFNTTLLEMTAASDPELCTAIRDHRELVEDLREACEAKLVALTEELGRTSSRSPRYQGDRKTRG